MANWSFIGAAPYVSRCVICSTVIPAGCLLCMVCLDADLSTGFFLRTGVGKPKKPSTARDL